MNVDPMAPVVPARYARGLLAAAVRRGLSRAALLRQARITETALAGSRARVSVQQFSRLYGGIVMGLQDEACGLHTRAVPPGGIEMLCRAALTTTTLHGCLPVMARCIGLVMGDFRADFQAATAGRPARLTLLEIVPPAGDRALAYELALFTLCGVLAWLFGRRVPLAAVSLPFAKPRHAMSLGMLLAAPLHFGSQTASLDFAAETLSLQIVRTPEEVSRLMQRAPASLIEVLVEQAELPARLVALLQQVMPRPLTMEEAASRLAMSPRTLHRKLAAQGDSFQRIKDGWRLRQAMQWLSCTDIPVKQIAADLGFSDQATFRRAFAQWAGQPPGAFRRARLKPARQQAPQR
ncbi:HTH-type transcriptional activator RhaS [compost metagenome]